MWTRKGTLINEIKNVLDEIAGHLKALAEKSNTAPAVAHNSAKKAVRLVKKIH